MSGWVGWQMHGLLVPRSRARSPPVCEPHPSEKPCTSVILSVMHLALYIKPQLNPLCANDVKIHEYWSPYRVHDDDGDDDGDDDDDDDDDVLITPNIRPHPLTTAWNKLARPLQTTNSPGSSVYYKVPLFNLEGHTPMTACCSVVSCLC